VFSLFFLLSVLFSEIDPMLDPVLEKQIVRKGKTLFINVSDQYLEYNPKFSLFFISRLPNPHFSPELQAKTTVIDFTVTMKGLEEQLLGRVSQGLKSTCNRPKRSNPLHPLHPLPLLSGDQQRTKRFGGTIDGCHRDRHVQHEKFATAGPAIVGSIDVQHRQFVGRSG
jgi:hypothetical protein